MKCLGLGLATPLGEALPPDRSVDRGELDVGPRAAAAVAVEGGPCELRFWDWRG